MPQAILVPHKGRMYLLERLFDEEADVYQDFYSVYNIIDASLTEEADMWNKLANEEKKLVCTVRVEDVRFDDSKRETIDAALFRTLPKH